MVHEYSTGVVIAFSLACTTVRWIVARLERCHLGRRLLTVVSLIKLLVCNGALCFV